MKASSESGECASLISTVSFSVFEAACWPRMGVQIRLPEFLQQLEILVPTALIEAFAQRVRSVAAARGAILVAGSGAGGAKYGAKHLPRGVENQSMPEVPGNGFVALAALADDGRLHGFGDAVRTFVEQNFKGRRTLIA